MHVLALSARSYRISTRLASGAWPITCPPASTATLAPTTLEHADLLYLCLHGRPDDPFLYGDRDVPLLDLDRVGRLHLDGALVYLAGCHGAGRPAEAFLAAGASAVVADTDLAWAGRFLPLGSQALGRAWFRHLAAGMPAGQALDVAKKAFADRRGAPRDREMLDTVRIYGDGRARARRARAVAHMPEGVD